MAEKLKGDHRDRMRILNTNMADEAKGIPPKLILKGDGHDDFRRALYYDRLIADARRQHRMSEHRRVLDGEVVYEDKYGDASRRGRDGCRIRSDRVGYNRFH